MVTTALMMMVMLMLMSRRRRVVAGMSQNFVLQQPHPWPEARKPRTETSRQTVERLSGISYKAGPQACTNPCKDSVRSADGFEAACALGPSGQKPPSTYRPQLSAGFGEPEVNFGEPNLQSRSEMGNLFGFTCLRPRS